MESNLVSVVPVIRLIQNNEIQESPVISSLFLILVPEYLAL